MIRHLAVLATAVTSLVASTGMSGCGLPDNDGFVRMDADDDGFGLSETSTTSTAPVPTSTIDATTSTSIAVTSTSIATEQVDIYFPVGRGLNAIEVSLPIDPKLSQVMARLLEGPPQSDVGSGLRAILPRDAPIIATKDSGVATVDLPVGLFDEMSATDQRLVFGQIALTLTNQRGVGQVLFTQGGQPMSVYLGNGTLSVPGEPVSEDDYTILLGEADPPIQTTTSSTGPTPTSAVPEPDPTLTVAAHD